MENIFLGEKTACDIDKRVTKVLSDLGYPEPPLFLPDVRELLRLDLQYYRSGSEGAVREFIHHMTMAGKQVLKEPSRIIDAIKKWDLKALYLPDRKRILLDASMPKLKLRWGETHEIGHSIIKWHEQYMLGDDQLTLRPVCHAHIEAEANYAAGRMLFMQDQFVRMLGDVQPSLESIKGLAKRFGNTITCTLCGQSSTSRFPPWGS